MHVACPICHALHDVEDPPRRDSLKQAPCHGCGANLVLMNARTGTGNQSGGRTAQGSALIKARAPRPSSTRRLWGIAAIATLCIINYSLLGAAVYGLHYSVTHSEAYQTSVSFLRGNEVLKHAIGDNMHFGFLPSGRIRSNGNRSTAEFSISVTGPHRSTIAWVALVKQDKRWRVVKASYQDASGTFQPLLSPKRPIQMEQPAATPVTPRISQEDILVILAAYDKAVNERNVEAIVAHMADSMSFKASVRLTSEIKTLTFTRRDYQRHLQKHYLAATSYTFQRTGTSISITPDGTHAKARFGILEESTFQSGHWRFRGTEVMHFALENGRPLITRLELTGRREQT